MASPRLIGTILGASLGLFLGYLATAAALQRPRAAAPAPAKAAASATPKPTESCADEETSERRQACVKEKLAAGGPAELCDLLEKAEECYLDLAKTRGIPSLCGKAPPKSQALCIVDVAQSLASPSVCDDLPDNRDRCFAKIAELRQDASICERIKTMDARCKCATTLSMRSADPSACELCPAEHPPGKPALTYEENCLSSVARSLQRDPVSICAAMKSVSARRYCATNVARSGFAEACELLEAPRQVSCVQQAATSSQRADPCSALSSARLQDVCWSSRAQAKPARPSLCRRVRDGNMRDQCLMDSSKRDGICLEVSPARRAACVKSQRTITDARLCQYLSQPKEKQACLNMAQAITDQ